MKIKILSILPLLFATATMAFNCDSEFELSGFSNTVPENKFWIIEGLTPYESQSGIGTADLSVNGQAQIGLEAEFFLYGEFEITFSADQTNAIILHPHSTVAVGDSRGTLIVKQCQPQ